MQGHMLFNRHSIHAPPPAKDAEMTALQAGSHPTGAPQRTPQRTQPAMSGFCPTCCAPAPGPPQRSVAPNAHCHLGLLPINCPPPTVRIPGRSLVHVGAVDGTGAARACGGGYAWQHVLVDGIAGVNFRDVEGARVVVELHGPGSRGVGRVVRVPPRGRSHADVERRVLGLLGQGEAAREAGVDREASPAALRDTATLVAAGAQAQILCGGGSRQQQQQQQRERRIDIDREGGRGEIRSGDAPRSSPRRWNPSAGRGPCRSGRRRRAARTRVGQSVDGWREAVSGRRKQGHVPMLRTRTRRSHAAPVTPAGVLHVRSRATHAPSLGTLRIATRSDHCAMMISQGSRRKY